MANVSGVCFHTIDFFWVNEINIILTHGTISAPDMPA